MKNLNLLSRSEMKKVLGGTEPVAGEGCEKTCTCDVHGRTATAKLTNCDKGTCDTSGNSAHCYIGGANTFHSCPTACGNPE